MSVIVMDHLPVALLSKLRGGRCLIHIGREGEDLPASAEIIEIPIAPDRKLRALYLVRDPKLDRCIAAGGWRVFPIHP